MSSVDPFPGVSVTAQDLWFDAMLRHQIGLLRRSSSIRNQLLSLLDKTEGDLRAAIRNRLRRQPGTRLPSTARLSRLLTEVETIRNTAWREVIPAWRQSMIEIALTEPQFTDAILRTVVPVQLNTTLPAPHAIRSLLVEKPFEGRILRDWGRSIRQSDIARIHDQIRIGIVQGEGVPEISRRVVGTASFRGRNGVTEITRRHATALVRTSANHFANQARQAFFEENSDIVMMELYIATLDSRTTPICRALDGKKFPLGEGPIPPLHFNCRSIRTAIIDEDAIGERPYRPTTERMLLREYSGQSGLDDPPRSREGLPRGHKGRFDRFARSRTRELVGRTPAKTTYEQFARRQSAEFQDDILGPTRGALFRRGGLRLDNFVDINTGRLFRLDELVRMHRRAFAAAGLTPEEFLR